MDIENELQKLIEAAENKANEALKSKTTVDPEFSLEHLIDGRAS